MKRWMLVAGFGAAMGFGYLQAQRNVPLVDAVVTEEGQQVVFDRSSFQARELAKRLPLEEAWPTQEARAEVLKRYGLDRDLPPQAIPVPARIVKDVYLVGQDRVSNLTYLVDCGEEGAALIDPTYESEFEHTREKVRECGFDPKKVKWVINTHCHMDHAMADRKFRDAGSQILIHEADAAAVERATRVTGGFTGKLRFPPCPVDWRLVDGEELALGNKVLHVIHTPGHTPGSASFLLQVEGKNVLFAGDTALYDGRLGWNDNPYADNRAYVVSLEKLVNFRFGRGPVEIPKLRWDVLLPGHGCISMDKAYLDIQKDWETAVGQMAAGKGILSSPTRTPEYRAKMYGRPRVEWRAGGGAKP
jgi:glyoxylase-like metal-dependent hydrolase (beta-lactamase superfamily II)